MRRGVLVIGATVLVVACSSTRDAQPVERPTSPPEETTDETTDESTDVTSDASQPSTSASADSSTPASGSTSTPASSTSTTATVPPGGVKGTAVAGAAGGVEQSGPPFPGTDPFAEAVRLADGTCIGWAESQAGSTAGLQSGAPVVFLDPVASTEIGRGTITASRWEDMSAGGEQWNCLFDFTGTFTTPQPAEFRIRVGNLEPWTARPDPTDTTNFVASVSSDANIARIASCPPLPATPPTGATTAPVPTTAAPTAPPGPPVTGWVAIGQYWSRGVDNLCRAGLPVTAVARPCRPEGVGSEYISAVVETADPAVSYANGAPIPLGTPLTVAIATGRRCE